MSERELYSRFVMVLNEKKAKIRGLQDVLRQLQQTDDQQREEEGRQRSDMPWLPLKQRCVEIGNLPHTVSESNAAVVNKKGL